MNKFNFDEWSNLYQTDPVEYERRRTELLNQTILTAPVECRNHLRMIQLEVDTIRNIYSPEESAFIIAEMMLSKLKEMRVKMTELREIIEDSNENNP